MIEKLLVLSILVSAWSGVHAGETYRWEDAEGNVHYTGFLPPADARNIGHCSASALVGQKRVFK